MKTVTEILQDKYNFSVEPSYRGECPECGERDFTIKADNMVGKCWGGCGLVVTPNRYKKDYKSSYEKMMDDIYKEWNKELLSLKNSKDKKNAYKYCNKKRGLHSDVIKDSMMGAVPVGCTLNIEKKFKKLIKTLKRKIIKEKENNKEKNKSKKKLPRTQTEQQLDLVREAKKKLFKVIDGVEGWVAFFYTDEYLNIISIRFRKPFDKKVFMFKPYKDNTGIFGLNLCGFEHVKELIGTEGEFNSLQAQSIMKKSGYSYTNIISVGGCNNADYKVIREVCSVPTICYDNDKGEESGAGFTLVKNAIKHINCYAFTTPEVDSDLDSFLLSFGKKSNKAYKEFQKIAKARKKYYRTYESIKEWVIQLRQNSSKKKEFEVQNKVAEAIKQDMNYRGKFYFNEQVPYFFNEQDKSLILIDEKSHDLKMFLSNYGLISSEKIYPYIVGSIKVHALKTGTETEIQRLSYYDKQTFTCYLFNNQNQIYKISPKSIDLVDNGTDGVMFLPEVFGEAFEAKEDTSSELKLWSVLFDGLKFSKDNLTKKEKRKLMKNWNLSIFFSEIMSDKTILNLEGEKGSGKSVYFKKCGKLIIGSKYDVLPLNIDSSKRNFDVAGTNNRFIAIDNADTYVKWFQDWLAVASTGGNNLERKYYTNNDQVINKFISNIGITTREQKHARDDIADRYILIKLDRIFNYDPSDNLLDEINNNRSHLMWLLIKEIQKVCKALAKTKDQKPKSPFRMASFYDFCWRIAKVKGKEAEIDSIFTKHQKEQQEFTLEGDGIKELFIEWASEFEDQWKTNPQICDEIAEIANDKGVKFYLAGKYKPFSNKMRNLNESLKLYFNIEKDDSQPNRPKTKYTFLDESLKVEVKPRKKDSWKKDDNFRVKVSDPEDLNELEEDSDDP